MNFDYILVFKPLDTKLPSNSLAPFFFQNDGKALVRATSFSTRQSPPDDGKMTWKQQSQSTKESSYNLDQNWRRRGKLPTLIYHVAQATKYSWQVFPRIPDLCRPHKCRRSTKKSTWIQPFDTFAIPSKLNIFDRSVKIHFRPRKQIEEDQEFQQNWPKFMDL